MTTESKYAKNLTTGDWIGAFGDVYKVEALYVGDNGWVTLSLSDGQILDCLAYRSFDLY